MNSRPRLQGVTPEGERIDLPDLAEIEIIWDEGIPATILVSPDYLEGNSLSIEVGSEEDDQHQVEEYGVLVLRPGSCNVLDIEVETHSMQATDQ
ncbi:hypothetical protein [Marinospirillum insulare]|uniref:Uncharacterized protein n=1 Tax=Marinospirillum insulare TaxID=217169 RepID=A0ABQ5ZXF0_9GAMM|nr:hypothetical protein [Marinospirillum insulare]GLR63687.1 hypothetical protein GCM10007878_11220 [Marinospirillum insulare]